MTDNNDKTLPLVFTNNKEDTSLLNVLTIFYNGVETETLGIMQAKHAETGELCLVLVGIVEDGDDAGLYPIAKVLNKEESVLFMPPDGKGGYVDYRNKQ